MRQTILILGVLSALLLVPSSARGQTPQGVNSGGPALAEDRAPGPSGKLDYQTDLFTGRFGYGVPLELAPARHGSTPALALRYNSASENGWLGVGWELDLGYIQRETRKGVPVRWSGGQPLAEYDDAKGFVFSLNGHSSMLVNVATNEYRAEIEGAFLKFLLIANSNRWEVTDTSGNRYSFGVTAGARMGNPKPGWSSNAVSGTFRWALEGIQTAQGDTASYAYTNITGQMYPRLLAYNGHVNGLTNSHTVEFVLGARGDTPISLQSGYRVDQTRRLASVVHRVAGQFVWSNRLDYAVSPSTLRSMLTGVTRFGINGVDTLPPVTFDYSQREFRFESAVRWTNLFVPSGGDFNTFYGLNGTTHDLVDFDGDGLPDRVTHPELTLYTNWFFQRNTGSGFGPPQVWGPLGTQTYISTSPPFTNTTFNQISWTALTESHGRLLDINGDGRPDRVSDPMESYYGSVSNIVATNYGRLVVELNGGSNLTTAINWTNASDIRFGPWGETTDFRAVERTGFVRMLDINGDGLPDRVMLRPQAPYSHYVVQFNTGSGFTGTNRFGPYSAQGRTSEFNGDVLWSGLDTDRTRLLDINGDSLPDRVMLRTNPASTGPAVPAQQTNYVVELNNGHGFETAVLWTNVNPMAGITCGGSSTAGFAELGDSAELVLRDLNGDGLPDRLVRHQCSSLSTTWVLQLNTGTGFGPSFNLTAPVGSQGFPDPLEGTTAIQSDRTTLLDLNGDGLPDRVSAVAFPTVASNYFVVELARGPYPDLLTAVSNGIGGTLRVTYAPSTQYDNRATNYTGTAANDRVPRMLPFPLYTVASVAAGDGIYTTNTTTYGYTGGMWNAQRREFHGFAIVTETDPLGGSATHWFHQAGGRDHAALGEFADGTNAFAKKGTPFRVETRGTNGLLYSVTLNQVQQTNLAGGRGFAFIAQTLTLDHPGGNTNAQRATASRMAYNPANGNRTNEVFFGEVQGVNIAAHTFTDTVPADTLHVSTVFAALANPDITDRPARMFYSADGTGNTILRESLFDYAGTAGNLVRRRDRICPGEYRAEGFGYDTFNNPVLATNAAGVVTATVYDTATRTFPAQQTAAGSFVTTLLTDARSGLPLSMTDPKGLVTSNRYDAFLRPVETLVSAASNGPANVWQVRHAYTLGGIGAGGSLNSVLTRRNDGLGNTNGHETYLYTDGRGRLIQSRVEAETGAGANQFRVSDMVHDARDLVRVETQSRFGTGSAYTKPSGSLLAMVHEHDAIGRPVRTTPAQTATFSAGGFLTGTSAGTPDTGSPVGPLVTAYHEGTTDWVVVRTDEAGKVRKYLLDGFGRTNQIIEVTTGGNFTSLLKYDRLGQLTNLTDHAGNKIEHAYNDIGEMVAMADANLGAWLYRRDVAGRIREQVDGNGQRIKFLYDDPLGRVSGREIYRKDNTLSHTNAWLYDGSGGDAGFTVGPGQVFAVFDNEGWEKRGHDVRGRTVKTVRYLAKTGATYTNLYAHDDANRTTRHTHPGGALVVTNTFDTGLNLATVARLVGGSPQALSTATGFNEVGQLSGLNFGNGKVTTHTYHPRSRRLAAISTPGAQALAYTYDAVSNVKSITDSAGAGAQSATLTGLNYDDLHRLTALTHPGAQGTRSFTYSAIGNTTLNGEAGAGAYNYGAGEQLPHAVRSANGKSYAYDGAGNMVSRGGQHLVYDAENRLVEVRTNGAVLATFGYDAEGMRLWKETSTNTQVWIGSTYEEKNGKALFHVFAGTRRVVSLDSVALAGASTNEVYHYYHPDHLGSTTTLTDRNGALVERTVNSAYGREWSTSGSAFRLSNRFTGQVADDETGLYYYGARYYDPELARFIQPDTIIPDIGNPQSWNRYSYTLNNPLKYTDPSGHEPMEALEGWMPWAAEIAGRQRLNAQAARLSARRGGLASDYNQFATEMGWKGGMSGDLGMVAAGGRMAADAASTYVNAAPDIASGGIKSAATIGAGAAASKIGEAPGMLSRMFGKGGSITRGAKALEHVPAKYRGGVARSFADEPIAYKLSEDMIVYRHWGGKAAETGSPWFSPKPYSKSGNAQRYLALPEGNSADKITAFRIPAGTTVLQGKVASRAGEAGFGRSAAGGGTQIYVSDPKSAIPLR